MCRLMRTWNAGRQPVDAHPSMWHTVVIVLAGDDKDPPHPPFSA